MPTDETEASGSGHLSASPSSLLQSQRTSVENVSEAVQEEQPHSRFAARNVKEALFAFDRIHLSKGREGETKHEERTQGTFHPFTFIRT